MKVKLWGTRGSLPAPLSPEELSHRCESVLKGFFNGGFRSPEQIPQYLETLQRHKLGGYGGNTPCCEVSVGDHRVILDAGSGIRNLGYELLQGPCGKGTGEAHLLFTHFHWDHLIGLPFFTPLFIPGNTVHVYSVQPELEEVFRTVFRKPFFPVPLEQLGSRIVYHRLEPRKPLRIGEISLTPYQLDHPDPCWGYRVESGNRVLAYCVDTEGTRISREKLGPDLPLYQGVDVMIYDAQYTLMEKMEKINWGHAAASIGMDIAMREKISRVIFMHHDPASNDEKVAMAEAEARRYYKSRIKALEKSNEPAFELHWSFAYEGMTFDV